MIIFLCSGLDKEEKMFKIGFYGGFLRITASALNGKQFSRESLGVLELFPSCHKRRRPWKEFFPRAARRLIGVEDSCVMLEHARSFRCSCCSLARRVFAIHQLYVSDVVAEVTLFARYRLRAREIARSKNSTVVLYITITG
jgi:hypothetical protein